MWREFGPGNDEVSGDRIYDVMIQFTEHPCVGNSMVCAWTHIINEFLVVHGADCGPVDISC